jgi:hypothetical protein
MSVYSTALRSISSSAKASQAPSGHPQVLRHDATASLVVAMIPLGLALVGRPA